MPERMPCRITDGPQTPEEQAEWDSYWDAVDTDIGQREDDNEQLRSMGGAQKSTKKYHRIVPTRPHFRL